MIRPRWFPLLLPFLFAGAAGAQETGWDERLARRFSTRLADVEKEIATNQAERPALPGVPVSDQGGTGGFASLHPSAEPQQPGGYWMEIRCSQPGPVDLVALVPS